MRRRQRPRGVPLICLVLPALLASITPGAGQAPRRTLAAAAKRTAGVSFRDCPNCPEMVTVSRGSFTMGSPDGEPERERYEGPQHIVTIAKPFAAGKYPVTFAEWDACVAGGGCGGYRPDDRNWGRKDRPVINVSWNDAKAYVAWLSRKTGRSYRLLSEAEREYVTRAGTVTPFWWGAAIKTGQANYDGTGGIYKGGGEKGEYRQQTVPVKTFLPNAFGLYQVHGNVWEWIEDCWNGSYEGAPNDGSPWTGEECTRRVLRGGSWGIAPKALRAASRSSYFPTLRDAYTGFRVARAVAR